MKKSTKKRSISQTATTTKPGRVGGRSDESRQVDWPKVGRRRVESAYSVQGLATALKSVREEKGVSLTALAKQLEVAPATLIKFEDKGHPVSIGVVNAMAEHLGCRLELELPPSSKK